MGHSLGSFIAAKLNDHYSTVLVDGRVGYVPRRFAHFYEAAPPPTNDKPAQSAAQRDKEVVSECKLAAAWDDGLVQWKRTSLCLLASFRHLSTRPWDADERARGRGLGARPTSAPLER